jgi:hypothetical protein
MGTSFFNKAGKPNAMGGGSSNVNTRGIGYATHGAALGAQAALKTAMLKPGGKPLKRSAAYPAGPKV